ncbi:MAG: hypothetical protein EOO16_06515 [Chitinophagaceae bacterium]|nr:MAG: hypothetical protein EOO16_06515 [Chitinophagaceae bacterium]
MKRWLTALALSWSTMLLAQTDSTQRFAPGALRADLDSLYAALRDNHPALYAQWPKADADRAFQRLRAQVQAPMTRLEFYRLTMPFVSHFRDGHTYLELDLESPDMAAYEKAGGRYFPLRVAIIGERLFTREAAGGAAAGTEIRGINGKASGKIIRELVADFPADGAENARASVERLFGWMLWLRYGWGTRNRLELATASGKRNLELPGVDHDRMFANFFPNGPTRELELHPEVSLGVVHIRNYHQTAKSKQFIDSCFRVLRASGIRNVALDLRLNGGGDSEIGTYFLRHITTKPQVMTRSKSWRLGPLVTALPATHWMARTIEGQRRTFTLAGEFLTSPPFEPEPLPALPDSLFLNARLFVLTSPRTFSSAHMTALAVKCSGMGTLIGQPTGERLDLTGEVLDYQLPHTRIGLSIPAAQYRSACGKGSQVGVQPDIVVNPTAADLQAGRDAAMEKLKAEIRKQ